MPSLKIRGRSSWPDPRIKSEGELVPAMHALLTAKKTRMAMTSTAMTVPEKRGHYENALIGSCPAEQPRRCEWKPAEQPNLRKQVQNRLPHRHLVLQAQRGGAARGAVLDAHVAVRVGCAPRDQLDQRLGLIGEA